MAKKSTPQPDAPPTLATRGGSYVADEAAGAVRQEGPSEAPPPSRRGFGAPDGVANTAPAATSNTSQE